ncbi:MAG: hypothetical protein CVU34_17160 [Betaproteobacteria bacterium HGW-Betaproteobacteria-7]|jgi:hypothetical protein|nr:MAG: hypothetical protein CVU34_17160 [Betaproteobacteria bacterium HGW-Betaproteobacteria-7]
MPTANPNRTAQRIAGLLLAVGLLLPATAPAKHANRLDSSLLGMPSGPWPLMRQGPAGPETYLVPNQLAAIRQLPEPERSNLLRFVREHEANLAFVRQTSRRFFHQINDGTIHSAPEYTMDLGEVMMGIDQGTAAQENPLHPHEPVLRALPPYTRVILLTPAAALARVRARLAVLGLSQRVQPVISQARGQRVPAEGVTRWVRDLGLVANDGKHPVLLASLAHKQFADVARNDLAYLSQIGDHRHHVVRLPVFVRGGNLALVRAGHRILLAGNDELQMNRQWFVEAFGFMPPPQALPEILKVATGADQIAILPNSRHLYHLDMFVAPLADGRVALLAPEDPERLTREDRDTLARARSILQTLGLQIVAIPTSAARIASYQSPANIVRFTDRRNGQARALVPVFPEDPGLPASYSLNARVLAAYRAAGIDPIPVEDRFHPRWGNTHCALLALH